MTRIIEKAQIVEAADKVPVIDLIEEGFAAYSQGRAEAAPVSELLFEDPPGEVHIKPGFIRGDSVYVIKVASSFYENPGRGLASSNGLMLVFEQKTGRLLFILLDEGYLTDLRTAAAGAVAARHLAPQEVQRIGILGTGIQARFQARLLRQVTDCRDLLVWGRNPERLQSCRRDCETLGYSVETTLTAAEVPAACSLIVTATASHSPLLKAEWIRPGTHITAVGSDTPQKIELDPEILGRADLVAADSLSQCRQRGEIAHALQVGTLKLEQAVELGALITQGFSRQPRHITVADLTGVAVQDVQIAKAVCQAL